MNRTLIAALTLLLVACEPPERQPSMGDYRCTPEEWDEVERRMETCRQDSDRGGYMGNACYRISVRQVCRLEGACDE